MVTRCRDGSASTRSSHLARFTLRFFSQFRGRPIDPADIPGRALAAMAYCERITGTILEGVNDTAHSICPQHPAAQHSSAPQ